jgi:hypothetical protein
VPSLVPPLADDAACGGEDRQERTADGSTKNEEDVAMGRGKIPRKRGFLKRALQNTKLSLANKDSAEREEVAKGGAAEKESGVGVVSRSNDDVRPPGKAFAEEVLTLFKTPVKKKKSLLAQTFAKSKPPVTAKIVAQDYFLDNDDGDNCIIANDKDSCGFDFDVTPNGIEMIQTPSNRVPFFDCALSPIAVIISPESFASAPDKAGSGSVEVKMNAGFSNDVMASCSLTDDGSLITADATPPPSMTHPPAKQLNMLPTPTENGETWNAGSFLFRMAIPPSPSSSVLYSSSGLFDNAKKSIPMPDGGKVFHVEPENFKWTLRDASAGRETANICMETVEALSTECNNQEPSKPWVYNPPLVKRILGFDADFNPCLSRASYRSRSTEDTPVYVNDRAGVVNHEGAKNESAFAKQDALEIVKQTRSRGTMRHK